jgi:hypothetical protein
MRHNERRAIIHETIKCLLHAQWQCAGADHLKA